MTNETRSPQEIEREIEEQRSDLTSNLEDLQDKFSIDTLVRQIGDQFREHGGDMGRSISNQVKANPIPLALTGIGLAWLMFGGSQQPQLRHRAADDFDDDRYSPAERDVRHSGVERGMPDTPPATHGTRSASVPAWARDHDYGDSPSVGDRLSSGAEAVKNKAADGAQSVKGGLASAASALGDAASSAKSTVGTATQSAKQGLATARNRIAEGTETLSEEGRKRVIAARQKAVEMRRSAARSMHQGTDAAADFYDQQPLVVGALALAVGAALGGALPRTKAENDLMGTQSDSLFDEAERIFQEEKAKALSVADAVKDEVKDIAAEAKADLDSGAPGEKSAAEAIGDKAKNAAERVADKAKSEAQDKNLGKPRT
ncbi:DUF3618 domain-containing protein [Roseobacter sp. YSTF-M11]|uniref:DUF3618 domain-containing protein n=1 Tax=Roseobacter insulae TaxID=2859783 RepID=A0A9X1K4A9_9RHOB|nr:DUF3618 domain-containing protein [Roseobacter insulae]MBW4709527.1 DUF3618 domain-containing protein [Roseobacter insulae]